MSLPTLVIGTKNLSSWSLRPWMLLKHLGIEFDELELSLDVPEFYRRVGEFSPTNRVPVLLHDDIKIWDSLAICEYANELADGKGWPRDRKARAHARSISAEMHSGFQGLRTCWPMDARATNLNVPLTEQAKADVTRIQFIWQECLQKHAGPWLFGDFSIADAMYAPVVLRFNSYNAQLDASSRTYVKQVLHDMHVQSWIAAARLP